MSPFSFCVIDQNVGGLHWQEECPIYYMSMAQAKPFTPAKLIVGVISAEPAVFEKTEHALVVLYGPTDLTSPVFSFNLTDYYESQMGRNLRRLFLSFANLVPPDELGPIKIKTNALEDKIGRDVPHLHRAVNIDPGILTASALIMGTAKNFAHRVPLARGIYAHLELLFKRNKVQCLEWTYPDFKQPGYQEFFLAARRIYLDQLRRVGGPGREGALEQQ
jgi:hypothetical protein